MRIEHLAMYVNDLEREKNFFETYFDAKAGEKYVHEEIGFSSYFLSFHNKMKTKSVKRRKTDDKPPYSSSAVVRQAQSLAAPQFPRI